MDRNLIAVEFAVVFENLRIRHNEGMPYWPHSNGEAGYFKFNGTLMKVITIAEAGLKTFKEELKKLFFPVGLPSESSYNHGSIPSGGVD